MAKRSGLDGIDDLLTAFTIVSGAVVTYDILFRGKSASEAAARHERTEAKLDQIAKSLEKLNAKLSGQ